GQQAQHHRHWPCDQHEHRSNYKRRSEYRNRSARRDEQAQHEEEDDLAEPGKGIKRLIDDLSGTMTVTAQYEARQIDRQEPACTSCLGGAEEGGTTGKRQMGYNPELASRRLMRASSR